MATLQEFYDDEIEGRREMVANDLREKYPEKTLLELKELYDEEIMYEHIEAIENAIERGIDSKCLRKQDVYALETACRVEGYDYSGLHDAGFKF